MRIISLSVVFGFALLTSVALAQPHTILIKGGHVIDAKNNINEVMDIAIYEGKIAKVAKNIQSSSGMQIVNAKGLYVTPGLIDLHTHVFAGTENGSYSNGSAALSPDGFTFRSGVTTVVDAGGAGWKSFDTFKRNIIDKSQTRVLSFLNIVGMGMRGGAYEMDLGDMDPQKTAEKALANKEYVVGFKHAHFLRADWVPIQRIVEAGTIANMPVMIDLGGNELPGGKVLLDDLFFKLLRPGDIYTHTFTEIARRDPVVDPQTRQLKSYIIPAQQKGILFDVGFGGSSFNFNQARPAIKAGFLPNTMGSDLHIGSMNGGMKDQLNVLSVFLSMGMDIQGVIARSTWAPAKAIKREDLGHLSEGSVADIAILNLREGQFGFKDVANNRQEGKYKFECEMTIKGGKIVYELNAISDPILINSNSK
ncbi:amidohydrolase/deacetylase family metallohydrolase [Daejeonella sp. H1SJ63]|uniref:amidohydrolase/deacetylase family metallohydrolase n=1 Tax=Daejeonella sp. H1SJ63 TaxID=3034145 RepID=UPI0023EDA9D8|nr:amidohydrolase/deacetylase family metallohydrolase [Daejeonella sp. H1SJ63]